MSESEKVVPIDLVRRRHLDHKTVEGRFMNNAQSIMAAKPLSSRDISRRLMNIGAMLEYEMEAIKIIYERDLGNLVDSSTAHLCIPLLAQMVIEKQVTEIFDLMNELGDCA